MRLGEILPMLAKVRRSGRGFMALCPAHDDRSPSLSLKETEKGDVLINCFAGCEFGDILAALGLRASDCFADGGGGTRRYRARHRAHELDSEVRILMRRYGFSESTARALVRVHLRRSRGGLV